MERCQIQSNYSGRLQCAWFAEWGWLLRMLISKCDIRFASGRVSINSYNIYSRDFLQTKHFGCISDILLPFSRRIYHVRTAKMSLYIENLSQNASFRRLREYIRKTNMMWCTYCKENFIIIMLRKADAQSVFLAYLSIKDNLPFTLYCTEG